MPTSLMTHSFWENKNPLQTMAEMAQFFKNLSLAVAALMIAYFGLGPRSLEVNGEGPRSIGTLSHSRHV